MPDIDPSTIVPNLVVGLIALLLGIVLVVFRDLVYALTAALQKAKFGSAGEAVSSRSSGFWVGVVGVLAIAQGLFQVGFAIVGMIQQSS